MTYTLTTGLAWFVVAFVAGGAVGYALARVLHRHRPEVDAPVGDATLADQRAELARDRARIAELEHAAAERDVLRAELDVLHRGGASVQIVPERHADAPPPPDTEAATEHLGRHIVADDLTVVVGIEQHTAMLCHWIGIHTWWDLASTPVGQLRSMLDDAGSRFAHLDPTTWPGQARLLAEGKWAEFAALAVELDARRS